VKRLIAFFALLISAEPALAQWEPPDEVLQVRVKGDGAWTVRCDYQDRRGTSENREAKGPKDGRLHLNRATGGTCTYRAAPDEPLTIRLKSALYQCTLPQPGEGCAQTFPAGASGQFEVRGRD